MQLHELAKLKTRPKKRVGRGESSGKGKTSGRGASGQKKREATKAGFEGGQLPLYRRLPQLRGVGNASKVKSITITTAQLNKLAKVNLVDDESLRVAGLVPKSAKASKIKIVAGGKLEKALKVAVPASSGAKKLILAAGGKITNEDST